MRLIIMHVCFQTGLWFNGHSHLSLRDLHCSRPWLWSPSHPAVSSSLRLGPPAAFSVWRAPPVQQKRAVRTFPPPPHCNTTNKPQHKDSGMMTWCTNTQATPALLCVRCRESTYGWEGWGNDIYRNHNTRLIDRNRTQAWRLIRL